MKFRVFWRTTLYFYEYKQTQKFLGGGLGLGGPTFILEELAPQVEHKRMMIFCVLKNVFVYLYFFVLQVMTAGTNNAPRPETDPEPAPTPTAGPGTCPHGRWYCWFFVLCVHFREYNFWFTDHLPHIQLYKLIESTSQTSGPAWRMPPAPNTTPSPSAPTVR